MGISSVTSEKLQLKLRQLLPSQQGFGTDLSAQDTIVPIIDLTASAEGSDVRADLQSAFAFGSVTTFDHGIGSSGTNTITTGTGFFRIAGTWAIDGNATATSFVFLRLNDGSTQKNLYGFQKISTSAFTQFETGQFDFIVFMRVGDTLESLTASTSRTVGTARQIADNNGVLIQPVGFTPQ